MREVSLVVWTELLVRFQTWVSLKRWQKNEIIDENVAPNSANAYYKRGSIEHTSALVLVLARNNKDSWTSACLSRKDSGGEKLSVKDSHWEKITKSQRDRRNM